MKEKKNLASFIQRLYIFKIFPDFIFRSKIILDVNSCSQELIAFVFQAIVTV